MRELSAKQVQIGDAFWRQRLEMNAQQALLHQWDQLEKTGCIDNFRLVAGGKAGFREGWFFADSDAYKWLDAASRAYATHPYAELGERIEAFINLIVASQAEDGYLYTYNQIHFPRVRWSNLQIEHELYCHGHLIEAAVSHYEATGEHRLLAVAEKAANLLVWEFLEAGPECTPGHEEIEIALIRLYHVTEEERYLALAKNLIERRGRIRLFAPLILQQNRSVARRSEEVRARRAGYLAEHPQHASVRPPGVNVVRKPPAMRLRYLLSALTGKYFQQHRPVREQTIPVGHSVRFAYLGTATAMLQRELGDETLLPALEAAWERMVGRRMYVTGGIGSLPEIEGFGRDYELDPEYAYAETCAALGLMFWNWEMALITRQARYGDLFEWQLYNAAAVGMGLDGRSYLYNNPLACRGGISRQAWYQVPCCPSNLSRTWAWLGKYLYSYDTDELWVHQYVGSEAEVDLGTPVRIAVESRLPWQGTVRIHISPRSPALFALHLRIPSWTERYCVQVNGQAFDTEKGMRSGTGSQGANEPTASGYSPHQASFVDIWRRWSPGDVVEADFPMPITARRAHPRLRSARGKVALTRGPVVYCLESVDNPALDLFDARIDPSSLRAEFSQAHLDGLWVLRGETVRGEAFTAIPYSCWAKRGESQMVVWVRA